MAIPTEKAVKIDEMIDSVLEIVNGKGKGRRESITTDMCVFCNNPATEFKDELSKREYRISGLCQKCQDEVFGG